MLNLITPASYWVLTILWLVILFLYLYKLRHSKVAGGTVSVLLTLLAIDAFRTLFESVYFGLYFNSMFGLLPNWIYEYLSQPAAIIVPKLINIIAGFIVLVLLIRRWVPREINEREEWIQNLQESESNLRESEEQYRRIVDTSNEGIWMLDKNQRISFINNRMAEMLGYQSDELIGFDIKSLLFKEDIQDQTKRIQNRHRGIAEQYERRWKHRNGQSVWTIVSATPIFDDLHQYEGAIAMVTNITARALVEKGLKEEIAFTESTLNAITDIFYAFDLKGNFLRWNETFSKVSGYGNEELSFMKPQDFFLGTDIQRISESIQRIYREGSAKVEAYFVKKDGGQLLCEFSGSLLKDGNGNLLGFSGTGRDITERKQAEREKARLEGHLQQSQKVESIGQLAGGVAHDFNNMLSVILGHAEIALMKADPSSPFISDLQEISNAAQHSAALTRQLLTFARKQVIAPKVLDLNDAVGGTLKMLQRLIGENIQLSWNPAANLWPVNVDPSQLDQILANLCVNARDAIAGVGKITIKTENRTLDESATGTLPYEVVPGDYVRLSVSDDGCGMDKKAQTHIFEPFYTTKEVGSGTGLGLATVYGAVKQNNGFLTFRSEPGQGTVFNIYLPRTSKTVEAKREIAEKPLLRGTETILLVEDDEMLLPLVTTMLEESGYTVLAAATTDLAQSLAKEHSGPIHLLVSDMIMPVMNGKKLSEKIMALQPDMKILFLSGYTADIISKQGSIEEEIHFLQKPFSFETLTAKVREVLDDY